MMRLDSSANGWLRGLLRPPYGTSLSAVVLAILCFGAVAVLHLLRPDLDPARHVLSEYANGGHGVIMTAVFYATGVACAALGWRLRSALDWSGITGAVPALLMLAGVALIVSGVFEVGLPDEPESLAETIHSGASISAFVLLIAAMLLFALACTRDPRWRSFRPIATALAVTAAAAGVLSPLADGTAWTGVAQRLLGGAVLLWLLLTARRVRSNAFRPHR
ncbi:MAG TPA: DUF998 domain-containing protein [Euzebyales bacterium]|nr:DUF998 domain-containing protein [Euzebyales bacterium]